MEGTRGSHHTWSCLVARGAERKEEREQVSGQVSGNVPHRRCFLEGLCPEAGVQSLVLSYFSPASHPPEDSRSPQLLTQPACPRGSCLSQEGDSDLCGGPILSLTGPAGLPCSGPVVFRPELLSPTCFSSHFPQLFLRFPGQQEAIGLKGREAQNGRMEGGGLEGPLGAQEDMGAYWSWE